MFGVLGTAGNRAQGCSWGNWLKSAHSRQDLRVRPTWMAAARCVLPRRTAEVSLLSKKPNVSREKTFTCWHLSVPQEMTCFPLTVLNCDFTSRAQGQWTRRHCLRRQIIILRYQRLLEWNLQCEGEKQRFKNPPNSKLTREKRKFRESEFKKDKTNRYHLYL